MRHFVLIAACFLFAANVFAVTFTGTITTSDPVQAGRLIRDGVTSSCSIDKQCPGPLDAVPRHYHAFEFTNQNTAIHCLFIFSSSSTSTFISVYAPSFDPNNVCSNYIGDMGDSSQTRLTARLPALTNFTIVVTEVDPNVGGDYRVDVDDATVSSSLPCPPGDFQRNFASQCTGAQAIFRDTTTGTNTAVALGATSGLSLPSMATDFSLGGVGYFSASSLGQDMVWRSTASGQNVLWLMSGRSRTSTVTLPPVINPSIEMVGSGDFNGDGSTDLLFRNAVTGGNTVWLMSGSTISSIVDLVGLPDPNYRIAGAGDFNGDQKPDILWHNSVTGAVAVWLMNGTSLTSVVDLLGVSNTQWDIGGVADVNNDGSYDVLWYNASAPVSKTAWLMSGTTIQSTMNFNVSPQAQVIIAGPK